MVAVYPIEKAEILPGKTMRRHQRPDTSRIGPEGKHHEINIISEGNLACVYPENAFTTVNIRHIDDDPPVESPWGESQLPEALAPFHWSPAAVYSPYSAPPGSSAQAASR